MGCTHTFQEHEDFKRDGVWESLEFIGFQPGDDVHGDIEMRNVPGCESTICRRCKLTEAQREDARAYARAKRDALMAGIASVMAVAA